MARRWTPSIRSISYTKCGFRIWKQYSKCCLTRLISFDVSLILSFSVVYWLSSPPDCIVFTARCYPVRPRCPSVCLSALYSNGWRYRQTSSWARYRHHSSCLTQCTGAQFSGGVKYTEVEKFYDFRLKSAFSSETVRDRLMVTIEC